jgi:hypothetical protein
MANSSIARPIRRISTQAEASQQVQWRTPQEDCPSTSRRVSCECKDMGIDTSISEKKVIFSLYSSLHVYQMDEEFERNKSYTSKERKSFQAQALRDAFRIQSLIESCPYEGGHAIRYLMDKKLLRPEELLGIESMIMGAKKIMKERCKHSVLVLKAQKELLKTNDADMDLKIAYLATARSTKTFEKARLRAALAA